jgi:ion channel
MDPRSLRRMFLAGLLTGLHVIWPVLSILLGLIIVLGLIAGLIEGWSVQDSLYFSFVTGLTIGYGDLVPRTLITRSLAVVVGMAGVLVTALVAAVAVKALSSGRDEGRS